MSAAVATEKKDPAELLLEILNNLERRTGGIRGAAVADKNGLPIANGFREQFDLSTVVAMSTLVARSSKSVFDNIGLKGPCTVIMEGEDSKVVVQSLGDGEASFIAVLESDSNLGLVKMEMRKAGSQIEEILGLATSEKVTLHDIFVMNKSGLLIRHYSRAFTPGVDSDILSGMIVAVQDFVRDALRSKDGTLDELKYGKYRIVLVRGKYTIVAAVISGGDSQKAVLPLSYALKDLEEKYKETLEHWDGNIDRLAGIDEIFGRLLED